MPVTITRSSIVTRAREAAGMESSAFVTSSELNTLSDVFMRELYDKLVAARGQEYYRKSCENNLTAGTWLYVLPYDFMELLGVAANESACATVSAEQFAAGTADPGSGWQLLRPFMIGELPELMNRSGAHPFETRYRLTGQVSTGRVSNQAADLIELRPTPRQSFAVRIEYVPTCVYAESGGERYYSGVDGWEEYAALKMAMRMLGKQESSTSHLQRDLDDLNKRLDALAAARDAGRPERIVDVRGGALRDLRGRRWWP